MKLKTHYDPYSYEGTSGAEGSGEPYYCEGTHMCGAIVSEDNDVELTTKLEYVTCKRCLRQKESIDKSVKATEEEINKQMGDMADFLMKEQ